MENTLFDSEALGVAWDHLHIRGEYLTYFVSKMSLAGSPPHTWRILFPCAVKVYLNGITSTYVENTIWWWCLCCFWEDHLHIRGEYNSISPFSKLRIGITSTYVENTKKLELNLVKRWDHLHIRGEYDITEAMKGFSKGSPPHTWRIPSLKKSLTFL